MKKILLLSLIIISSAFIFNSCDEPEGPYIEANPYTGIYDSDLPIRKILLEDFTGYKCTNCPLAADEIGRLQASYGDHIIPISVHTGWFAGQSSPEDPDFETEEGAAIAEALDILDTPPWGVINRKVFSEGDEYEWSYNEWSTLIFGILQTNQFADIDISMHSEYIEAAKTVNVEIEAEEMVTIDAPLKICLYMIESHIIGKQSYGSYSVDDYEHNHVLRAGMIESDPTWGEAITLPLTKTYSFTLADEWVAENCAIVAFIYNSDTKEIIQSEEIHVIE